MPLDLKGKSSLAEGGGGGSRSESEGAGCVADGSILQRFQFSAGAGSGITSGASPGPRGSGGKRGATGSG